MALKDMSLLTAATVASTGGTALVFSDDGITVPNGVHLIVPADADYQTRRMATFKVRPATVAKAGVSISKDKKSVSFAQPKVLLDGSVVFNLIRIEREMHPTVTAAEAAEFNRIGAQLLTDTDTDAFWANGSTN